MPISTSLRVERRLLRDGAELVCGMDEVGRGALSGPVSVGAAVVDASTPPATDFRDSKVLTPRARAQMAPRIRDWSLSSAVGHASAEEIDSHGIIGALRLAANRALAMLTVMPEVVLLDGRHDWLTPAQQGSLFEVESGSPDGRPVFNGRVVTQVKADMTCTSVAAASVLAKIERDAIMTDLAAQFPEYGWAGNKGYASPEHIDALTRLGPTSMHRRSWRLPGVTPDDQP
ncbi:MAG: ribonuclease HII [Candidatus Nanopelagicales bacterium]|nr:ribonuclease HII [Candidatus Nanopelagicales bacterium]MCF8536546.1 ribonuclease HII [Candidatus Nanopelagicales bacterium]MCF8541854.1 ribonuclease HII [Candidatus Nanopelagicales bacterium]MCF8556354.1 ribonuclease HII [Candidatus Nanopelagicales bacterium]